MSKAKETAEKRKKEKIEVERLKRELAQKEKAKVRNIYLQEIKVVTQ